MQNYGQASGYQHPGSAMGYAGQENGPPPVPPPPPGYGGAQGYQSAAPQAQSQWAAPTLTHTSNPWNQSQPQAAGGYNPGTYGALSGGQQQSYAPQQHDQPPPPPPKPYGFAAAVQRQEQQQQQQQQQHNAQNWPQQPQQNTGFTPQAQQGGYPVHGTPQQAYHNAAPPPPSATPGGSYFPSPQGSRPNSVYGASQAGSYANAPSVNHQHASTVVSPTEQQPAYIPPSLSGQGVQAYMPSNTNPAPGVYVPPPPNVPAWQQAQHAPLQSSTKKFTYTRPTVDPSYYAQGTQSPQPLQQSHQPPPPLPPRFSQQVGQAQQQQQPYHHYEHQAHAQYPPQTHTPIQSQQTPAHFSPQQQSYQQQQQQQQQQGQFVPGVQPQQQSPGQPEHPQAQYQQQQPYMQHGHDQQVHQPQNQWQPPPPPNPSSSYHHAQTSYETQQVEQQPQVSPPEPQYSNITEQSIQNSRPIDQTPTAPSNFFYQPSPQSQPVSPISNRPSLSFASGHHPGPGRNDSIGSIALANLHAQRTENRTSSPKLPLPKPPSPPPPRDDKSKFSVLAAGAPSDWEYLGGSEEIDDEEIFGVKKENERNEAAQPSSVELPAHVPSPPSTQGFPSPAVYPARLESSDSVETYVPTPPSVITDNNERYSPGPTNEGFVVEDAIVAPLRTTPKPTQGTRPPGNSFGGAWAQPNQMATAQHEYLRDPSQQSFAVDGGDQTAQLPTQNDNPWTTQPGAHTVSIAKPASPVHTAELQAKDEVISQLKADLQQEKDSFEAEMKLVKAERDKLESESWAAKEHASSEMDVLQAQIENMRLTADIANANSDAAVKEKALTIDRLKEDVEGKEHNLEERDGTIAELRSQLEAEKTKEIPKPTAADLIPDLDPWYVGSLERYIAMLRGEATEPQVEEKIKIFKAFMKAESNVRGIDFFDAPPRVPEVDPLVSTQPEQAARSRGTSNASVVKHDLNVQIPQDTTHEDDCDYSPGGRPIIAQRPTILPIESVQVQPQTAPSVQSTTILTPTSSIDDDTNKTPVQSQPEEQLQSQYRAYIPPAAASQSPVSSRHGHAMSFSGIPGGTPSSARNKGHDEIFFGANQPATQTQMSRPSSKEAENPMPAPLSMHTRRDPSPKEDPNITLAGLLPQQLESGQPSRQIQELRAKLTHASVDSVNVEERTTAWEKSASLKRRKNDDARRKREEENEEHDEDLFNHNELSYADMKRLEDVFKQKEAELKTQEVAEEYKDYMEIVFDPIYNGLQLEIKTLMDLCDEAEHLLQTSVSGIKSLESSDPPSTEDCLELLEDIHKQVEKRHSGIVYIVAERDRRYKKTEIHPLYTAGKTSQLKELEKHFEAAEKQALLTAAREKAHRISDLVSFVGDTIVNAIATEQQEIDHILAAIKALDDTAGHPETLDKALSTLTALKLSSKALLSLFNDLECEKTAAECDVEVARAQGEGKDKARVQALETEKVDVGKRLVDEYMRRVSVLESDEVEIRELVGRKTGERGGGDGDGNGDREKEERLRMALEEAKRRNGHI